MHRPFLFLLPALAAVHAVAAPAFDRDVAPILRAYCAGCHRDGDAESEFSVETYASLRRGGAAAGDPIVPGDPAGSEMIRRLASTELDHMPPADEPQPSAAERAVLAEWIAGGAAGPDRDASILAHLVVPTLPAYPGPQPITSVAIAADGRSRAVARGRGLVLIRAGGEPANLTDLPDRITAVHFDATGTRLVVAGGISGLAGVVQIRDAADGSIVATLAGHRDLVADAEFSPDGALLASVGFDRSVKIWDVATAAVVRSIDIHNGAVFDVAWHPSGRLVATASADETVKLWRVSDGARLDTLSQPQGEVTAVVFTPDGGHILAAGRDKRIHAWRLVSLDEPAINPAVHARFAHESPLVALALSADGRTLLSAAEDASLTAWSLPDLALLQEYPQQPDVVSALAAAPGDAGFLAGRMDGSLDTIVVVPRIDRSSATTAATPPSAGPPGDPTPLAATEPDDTPATARVVPLPVAISGTIDRPGDVDHVRFTARRGERFILEIDAARSKSRLDSRIEVLDATGTPVEQVVLQAVRDSFFTFRGKDSSQSDDFRLQNWTEMELDEYLYAGGEVVRLWLYPRGPDSGFKVYPGAGTRHTFFGTTAVTHALGEPAWIVSPLPPGTAPVPNGLPVFRVPFANDDEPTRRFGADSQLLFTAPADGEYVARVSDVRGFGLQRPDDDWHYTLTIRPPRPAFAVQVGGRDAQVSPGSGRELEFTTERFEGFEGPIRIVAEGLPAGFTFHGPIDLEARQRRALAVLSAAADAVDPDAAADAAVKLTAVAEIDGREVVQDLGTLGNLTLGPPPKLTVRITAADGSVPADGPLEFALRPGETITARVVVERRDFADRVELGGDDSGRNLPHGLYVDNIGLNGLLVVEGQTEREFFITASPVAKPGRRLFHLRAAPDGGQTSPPAVITVLPREDVARAADVR